MELRLYNTLTRRKEVFKPIDPANVRIYVCGPTVYDFAHIGNARPAIVFDVLYRLLRHLYGPDHVTYVRNITDVDDKINARAARDFPGLPLNEAIRQVTEKTAKQYHEDVAALGCLEPTIEPRATEHIAGMVAMIQRLIDNRCAYVAKGTEGQEVLFDVTSMPDYGALSKRNLEDQQAGARVSVEAHKKNPGDFVLWKQSGADAPGWDASFTFEGKTFPIHGRPGWHIECSVMSDALLWEALRDRLSEQARAHPHQFDIHGGGLDLIFPHHENEIAQSRCAHGTPVMANYWLHNGFLQVEGQKMSKSLGNFVTIRELLTGWKGYAWPGQVIRLAMLSTQYTQPLDFSRSVLEQAEIALSDFATFAFEDDTASPSQEFMAALCDDLNTPRAIAELHRLLKVAKGKVVAVAERSTKPDALLSDDDYSAAAQLACGLRLLGIELSAYDASWAQKQAGANIDTAQQAKIGEEIDRRLALLHEKNFAEADKIRDELAAEGIQLMDYKDPDTGERRTKWEVKR